MAVERTLSIVKPDGVAKNLIGEVFRRFEKAGLKIIGAIHFEAARLWLKGLRPVARPPPPPVTSAGARGSYSDSVAPTGAGRAEERKQAA